MNKLLASLICVATTSVALAQQTLVVGPGQMFGAIAPAIAAAQAGDTVLVMAGTYPADFVIDKGIKMIGMGAQLEPAPFTFTGAVIENVPVGETCVFAGFSVDDSGSSAGDVTLTVRDCDGLVILRKLKQAGVKIWFVGVHNSAQVHIAEGVLRVGSASNSNVVFEHVVFDSLFFAGLSVVGGGTAIVGCTVNGGTLFGGSPAIQMDGGTLAITRSVVNSSSLTMPAIATIGGVIVLDPSVNLGSSSGQLVSGTAAVVLAPLPSLATRFDKLNSTLELANHGVVGDLFATVMSVPSEVFESPLGLAWVDPSSIVLVELGAYGPNRLHVSTLPLPPLPAGLSVALQSVVFTNAGLRLSTPSLLTID